MSDDGNNQDINIKKQNIISNEQIVNFFSGLLAGIISVAVCNPLDIARTRLNVLVTSVISRTLHHIIANQESTRTSLTP
jgi:hypothetical protein